MDADHAKLAVCNGKKIVILSAGCQWQTVLTEMSKRSNKPEKSGLSDVNWGVEFFNLKRSSDGSQKSA